MEYIRHGLVALVFVGVVILALCAGYSPPPGGGRW